MGRTRTRAQKLLRIAGTLALMTVLHGCSSASPGVAREVPPYHSDRTLTPYGLGAVEVTGKGNGSDRAALQAGVERVLKTSNYFDPAAPAGLARVKAQILRYSQPPAGMSFGTTLSVEYAVLAPNGNEIYRAELTTEGADDSGGAMAMQRASRAKTLAMANNLFDFRTDLEGALRTYTAREQPGYLLAAGSRPAGGVRNGSGAQGMGSAELLGEALVPLDLSDLDDGQAFESGTYYGLVIGNDEYAQLTQLETAANDARSVGELLESEYGFEVTFLIDATRAEILQNLSELRRKAKSSDSVLIYYAGHGWFDEGTRRGYWLPVDATQSDPSNWVSAADLTDILRAMAAHHVMVVADSCYSGSLTRGIQIQNRDQAYIQRLARKRARVVLTSGGIEPVVDSGSDGHSVFARAFLDTLQANQGVLEGVAVFNQIRKPVVLGADQTPEYGDIRFAGHEGGDFLFIRK